MLYALVLIVTTTTAQPVATGLFGYASDAYAPSRAVTYTSQEVIGYYRTERACLNASLRRSRNWPDFAPGQNVTGLCVQVEVPAGADMIGGS